jgi:hypothetical protein
MKMTTKTPAFYVATALAIIALAFGVLSLQAWLLSVILGWFSISLGFWKCFLIVFLIGMLFGGSRSSSS